ncbi:LOW QUALITY PROTEIN: taste receptor type 2 member 8 [Rhynchonycteris naso]
MLGTEDNVCMILITGEFIIGILGNGYIGLMNWIDWIKKEKISSVDYILTHLTLSRIYLLCVMVLNDITVFYSVVYKNDKLKIVNIFWMLTNYLSIFAMCLNVSYFLKIVNFLSPKLRWRIDRVAHWILLGSLTISLLNSCMLAMIPNYDFFLKIAKHRNITVIHVNKIYFNSSSLYLWAVVPFSVSLISFFLLIILWRHIKQIKLNVTGCREGAHVGAMKIVTLFLLLLFVDFLASLLVTFSYLVKESKLAVMFGGVRAILYPSGHSLALIIGSRKWRQASVGMLRCGKTACVL